MGATDIVKLTREELDCAHFIAKVRFNESRKKNLDNNDSSKNIGIDNLQWDILGASGEIAFAKWLDVEYTADVNTFHDKRDVSIFEIRTASKNHYNLIMRNSDREIANNPFVAMVQQREMVFRVVGWIYGTDCLKDEYLDTFGIHNRKSAYKIPQSKMNTDFNMFTNEINKSNRPFKIILPESIFSKYQNLAAS